MKKRTIVLWSVLCIFLSACVYLTLPSSCEKQPEPSNEKDVVELPQEFTYDDMIEAYFAGRPVRDVPQNADFSSFLVGTYAKNQRDFKTAAKFYANVLTSDEQNTEVKEKLYLYFVLGSQVDKAIPYAYQVLDDTPTDLLAQMVVLADNVKQGEYQKALSSLDTLKGDYTAFLNPLLKAWIYTGLNDEQAALKSLEPLQIDNSVKNAYYQHKALILDYFGNVDAAAAAYGNLMRASEKQSIRSLLLLKDFESRTHALTDKKSFALQYAALQDESFISKEMMSSPGDGERVKSPVEGVSWVFFDIASAFGQAVNLDLSLFFSNLALYLNPDSSITQLFMGEILEDLDLTNDANALYAKVKPTQNIFLSVQMRTVINQIKLKQTKQAILNLQKLIDAYPNAALFHLTLGDAYREQEEYQKALGAYKKAASLANPEDPQIAQIYFYQGVCLEAIGKKQAASEFFEKALTLDSENPVYLNYTGYTWLEQNKNIPQALELIQKAVKKVPNEGSFLDSLGWAYYLMGDYEKALPILERAARLLAGNAVINSHLGDVYWKIGRFREARFQWSHATGLEEGLDANLQSQLEEKIANGLK